MPHYEYICNNCGHELEEFQKMSDDPLTKCPECEKDELKRVISGGAGFILKGEGWAGKEIKKKKVYSEQELRKKAHKAGRKDIIKKLDEDKKNTSFKVDSNDFKEK